MYRFKIESQPTAPPAVITATYTGLVPDTFKSGAEVVVKGTLTPDNQVAVVPDGIMAKCPSKYDADEGQAEADPASPRSSRPLARSRQQIRPAVRCSGGRRRRRAGWRAATDRASPATRSASVAAATPTISSGRICTGSSPIR